ncbi:phenylalanine--tRNA ligase subunit beta [Thiomicrospira microaerophila]|uniref:phenylalanine--tRNA ligase subunit beta n=1 Tax=Thiomicrospira microaerophila TaxID=406020 RepID=UPI0005C8EDF3|nr:phenylalanine--tRNA ligase subunit beta [Thiomicrospira microaerophila]
MKVSEQWLRTWVNPDWDTVMLSEALSLAGLEVDDVELVAPAFSGVVVAQVVQVEKHPDAEKLNVTQVDVGADAPLQIVCGAPNVVVGMKVPCALVGAKLPGDFKIKKAKLRGVASSGMLCSGTEIGLEQDYDGLMVLAEDAPIGVAIRDYLQLDDVMIDVDLTPNRADCLSVEGLAREVALVSGAAFKQPFELKSVSTQGVCPQAVEVVDSQACPKYLGCVVEGYDKTAQTPDWMVRRLARSGVRAISLTVDITNYVLLELGQPMHAFDADKLVGTLQVRHAKENESLVTLDEKALKLNAQTLVIADDSGAIALAGVMGGLSTSVSDDTSRLFFECAHFSPLAIVGKARQYGLHTDSSHRFERGVDPLLPERALSRALQLFTEIAGGQISDWVQVVNDDAMPEAAEILLRRQRLHQLLGASIEEGFVRDVLSRLGCQVSDVAEGWQVQAPSYRFDMQIEVDLIEEVARIYGYNNLPDSQVGMPLSLKALPESEQDTHMLRQAMLQRGYQEVITYSFVEEAALQKLSPEIPYVLLKNPISEDMKAMRTSLFPGLLQTLGYNQKRQQNRVRIFETGLTFSLEGEQIQQTAVIGGLIAGDVYPAGWADAARKVDFYDLKGDVENLLAMSHLHGRVHFEASQSPEFHPGQCAAIMLGDQPIGIMGQLHPQWQKPFGVNGGVFMFQIFMDSLLTMQVPKVTGISKFPEVQRDLAFVVERSMPVKSLVDCIRHHEGGLLQDVQVFDIYQGQGVLETHKSVALSLRIQHHDRTLLDDEVDSLIDAIVQNVKQTLNAQLR